MNTSDEDIFDGLNTLLSSASPALIRNVWSETQGDLISAVKVLKLMLARNQGNNNEKETCDDFLEEETKQNTVEYKANPADMDTALANFENFDDIDDPDLKFALQLQREELENEKRLKRQQDDDSLFAIKLQRETSEEPQSTQNYSIEHMVLNQTLASNGRTEHFHEMIEEEIKEEKHKKQEIRIEEEEDDKTCVVCLDGERNAVFAPCAHRSCCVKCANQILNVKRFCPLCWTDLDGIIECQNLTRK